MRKHTKKRESLYILLELHLIYSYLFLNISVCLELLPVRHLLDSPRPPYNDRYSGVRSASNSSLKKVKMMLDHL